MQVMQIIQVMQKGTGGPNKTDEFSEKVPKGGMVIFNAKIYISDFGSFDWAFEHEIGREKSKIKI